MNNFKDKKKLTGLRIDDEIRLAADQSILIRASTGKVRRPETFSAYVRNLILEDYKRNKTMLESNE